MHHGFRNTCHTTLHAPADTNSKIINGIIAVLIILTIAIIPLHFISSVQWAIPYLFWLETFTVFIFSIEYILRTWSADRPIRYIFSWFGIIDLAAIIPFYLAIFGIIQDPEIFLLLRLLRLLKLAKTYHSERISVAAIAQKEHGDFKAMQHEQIEEIIQKHPAIFLFTLLPPLFGTSIGMLILLLFIDSPFGIGSAVLCFTFSFLFFIKSWLDFHYDVIYVTNHRLIVQNRQLFGYRINDITYESITNVRPDNTGFWRFLLGLGDIHIETAAASGNQEFSNAADPHGAVRKISENRQANIDQRTLRDREKENMKDFSHEEEEVFNPIKGILDASKERQENWEAESRK